MSIRPVRTLAALAALVFVAGCSSQAAAPSGDDAAALAAFATVERVLQHPRCSNCHIPGDAPLQFDAQTPHQMGVIRGADGHGAPGLPCSACHGDANSPASYGSAAPPGAPAWHLPPPAQKMDWIGVSPAQLCALLKDGSRNGGKDLEEMFVHVRDDKLVLWGWNPGGTRAPVPVPHAEFVAAFRTWADAGAPCPR
jgi:mono/diheme cytochrome c family protein